MKLIPRKPQSRIRRVNPAPPAKEVSDDEPSPHLKPEIERGHRILLRAAEAEHERENARRVFDENKPALPFEEPTFTWLECVEASRANPPKQRRPTPDLHRIHFLTEASKSPATAFDFKGASKWVKTTAYIASDHEDDLITLRLDPLIGTAVKRMDVRYDAWITLVVYVPRKRLPWELRVRVNRQNLSTAATIFWSPLLPTPRQGHPVEVLVLRKVQPLPQEPVEQSAPPAGAVVTAHNSTLRRRVA